MKGRDHPRGERKGPEGVGRKIYLKAVGGSLGAPVAHTSCVVDEDMAGLLLGLHIVNKTSYLGEAGDVADLIVWFR